MLPEVYLEAGLEIDRVMVAGDLMSASCVYSAQEAIDRGVITVEPTRGGICTETSYRTKVTITLGRVRLYVKKC